MKKRILLLLGSTVLITLGFYLAKGLIKSSVKQKEKRNIISEKNFKTKQLKRLDSIEKSNYEKSHQCKLPIILGLEFGMNEFQFGEESYNGFHKIKTSDGLNKIYYNFFIEKDESITFDVKPFFLSEDYFGNGISYTNNYYLYKLELIANYYNTFYSEDFSYIIKVFKEKYKFDDQIEIYDDYTISNTRFTSKTYYFINCNRKIIIRHHTLPISSASFKIEYIDLNNEIKQKKIDSLKQLDIEKEKKERALKSINEI